jgi:hypothetical protein
VRRYGFRPYSHQQSNKASAALWFEPQRCKSRNAHLRDFLEQQFHIFFDKLAGVAAGRARSAKAGKALQKNHRFHLGRFALRAFLSRHDRLAKYACSATDMAREDYREVAESLIFGNERNR